jgi:hypothetical protein
MIEKESLKLKKFAQLVLDLDIQITSLFRTKNNDYEIVTYIDEVQILDLEENIIESVKKNEKQS